jgi:membrane peptidoglycan carboxypeptidase
MPDNYDNLTKGPISLRSALAESRNIPAVKMFYLGGREEEIVKEVRSFGMSTVAENAGYGAPMAIGTAEVRPIDLMQAYSVIANLGVKRDVHAIEKIEDSDGNILEEYKAEDKKDPIFSPASAYIVTQILSDPEARPE